MRAAHIHTVAPVAQNASSVRSAAPPLSAHPASFQTAWLREAATQPERRIAAPHQTPSTGPMKTAGTEENAGKDTATTTDEIADAETQKHELSKPDPIAAQLTVTPSSIGQIEAGPRTSDTTNLLDSAAPLIAQGHAPPTGSSATPVKQKPKDRTQSMDKPQTDQAITPQLETPALSRAASAAADLPILTASQGSLKTAQGDHAQASSSKAQVAAASIPSEKATPATAGGDLPTEPDLSVSSPAMEMPATAKATEFEKAIPGGRHAASAADDPAKTAGSTLPHAPLQADTAAPFAAMPSAVSTSAKSSQELVETSPVVAVPQHAVLTAAPGKLEVGVLDGTHGWLQIRAELGVGGSVSAAVTGSAAAHDSLRQAVPAIASYLESEAVNVSRISIHRGADSALPMNSREQGSDQSGGQQSDSEAHARRQARATQPSQTDAGWTLSSSTAWQSGMPWPPPGVSVGRSPGPWLSVLA